jgi:multiple sugar transport system substrate-binding protein
MRRSWNRFPALAALAAAALLGASACGGSGSGGSGTTGASATTRASGTVTLASWSSSPEEEALLRKVIAAFEKSHPAIKVSYSVINGDYPTAMTARFSAHNPPDVFYVDSSVAPGWAKQGVLEPLDSYIAESGFGTSAFYPNLLHGFQEGGKTYGLPKDWSPLGMEIDTSMLSAAGQRAPTTWQQLQSVAQAMARKNVVPGGKPICLGADWARLLAFVEQNGGSLQDVTSPKVAQAVEFYVGLIRKGLAQTPDKLGSGWCGEALGKQKAAIIFEGNWLLPFMSSTYPKVPYEVFPMVRHAQRGNLAFTVSYSMAKDAKNKQAAWVLLSWLTSKQGQTLWVSKGLALPSRKDVQPVGAGKPFLAEAEDAQPWGFPNFSQTYSTMNNDLSAVITGGKSVQAMLRDVSGKLNQGS